MIDIIPGFREQQNFKNGRCTTESVIPVRPYVTIVHTTVSLQYLHHACACGHGNFIDNKNNNIIILTTTDVLRFIR